MFLTTRKTLKRFTHGFTLIELLIVIAIMGILAAAVLVAINPVKRQKTAKDANVQSDLSSIGSGLQAYYTQMGYYPSGTVGLTDNGDLKTVPLDPDGVAYTYAITPGTCTTVAKDCTGVSVSRVVYWPIVAGDIWCFQTSTGKINVAATAAGCPAL